MDLAVIDTVNAVKAATISDIERYTRVRVVNGGVRIDHPSLIKAGFRLFVSADVAYKFKYAASIFPLRYEGPPYWGVRHRDSWVIYEGDYPDFALARVEDADKLGSIRTFTIHSNQPLPVRKMPGAFARIADPVVIGWVDDPAITISGIRRRIRVGRLGAIGVVIAMWDMDKELSIE